MDNLYVACDFGEEFGRVMLGTLHKDKLTMSEVRRFPNQPIQEKDSLQWNIPELYQQMLEGLSEIGRFDEPVDSISCSSWPGDYMLFDKNGALLTPTSFLRGQQVEAGMKQVLGKIPWESIYDETGVQMPATSLFQLAAEKSKRFKKAEIFLPIADGFNFLLSGVPRVGMSIAQGTQLYNPIAKTWSEPLINALKLSAKLFPQVVRAGTELGELRAELAKATKLENTRVVTSCSDEVAAALAGLPVNNGEQWAYMQPGDWSVIGVELICPLISDASREMGFNNEFNYGGSVRFSKRVAGTWLLDECRRFWKGTDRDLDENVLTHLAVSAPPFESFIDPTDARFQTPGDMPLKIQAFCKETNQPVPRKPGPILRCVLESLALQYRKTIQEIEYLTGREIARLYIIGNAQTDLLNHFTANALQIPFTIAPTDATAIGNVMVQALAMGRIESLDQARDIVARSFKSESIRPQAAVWNAAYDRFTEFVAA